MNRNEIILELMNVYDENERLKRRLETVINDEIKSTDVNDKTETMSALEMKIFNKGKILFLEEITYSWKKDVNVNRNEETDELEVTTYKTWVEGYFDKNKVPSNFSYDEVRQFFEETLKEIYEKSKTKAIEDFKISEQN